MDVLDGFVRNQYDSADIRLQMAWILLLKGNLDQALNEVNHGLKLASNHELCRTKGELLLIKGDLRAAEAELRASSGALFWRLRWARNRCVALPSKCSLRKFPRAWFER